MAEELRKAELVRDRLEGLAQLMGSYPEGHDMRARLEALHVERALEGVDEDIRVLIDAIQHPRGSSSFRQSRELYLGRCDRKEVLRKESLCPTTLQRIPLGVREKTTTRR